MRTEALEMIYVVTNYSVDDAERMIARRLTAWREKIWERDANVCRNVAREWRDNSFNCDSAAMSLRERSAESAELCARRICPTSAPLKP